MIEMIDDLTFKKLILKCFSQNLQEKLDLTKQK
jgi:hypothetical protein